MRRLAALLSVLVFVAIAAAGEAYAFQEAPMLAKKVAKGELPPVDQRLPANPAVEGYEWPGQGPGKYGGEMDMLTSTSKDGKVMVWYGYARLVRYDSHYQLVPDILESFDVQDGRIFTFHLRKGHKWSDGTPFTSEDFRYYWEDVANNSDLAPVGPPPEMLVDGVPATFEVLDETTVRYTWSKPNAAFLPALANAAPLFIFRPSHYLKQFHKKYADPDKLKKLVAKSGQRSWAALHNKLDNLGKNDNPKLPTLDPWISITKLPADRLEFVRNPYFFRVDPQGRQLPYIDKVALQVTDSKLIAPKAGAGEATLQARGLRFEDYTFLKDGEDAGGYRVFLWHDGRGSAFALYPNLNTADPTWRALNRDVRFRRALSLGIDRHEINQVVYYGLAKEGGNTVLPQSALFKPAYQSAYATHDPKAANALLDAVGLTRRDSEGFRLLPDDRPLTIIVDLANQIAEESDVMELIGDEWRDIGIRVFTKPSALDVFRNRIFSGQSMMSVWTGFDDGIATADAMPGELAPVNQQSYQWPKWGQYYETRGMSGEPPDMPEAKELMGLMVAWRAAGDSASRREVWERMLQIYADQVYSIGIVSDVPQPVVVSRRLHNVPEMATYAFDPGAYFGIYHPDLFWLEPGP
jgi:peptide/nickel transport system substrate-binding protein